MMARKSLRDSSRLHQRTTQGVTRHFTDESSRKISASETSSTNRLAGNMPATASRMPALPASTCERQGWRNPSEGYRDHVGRPSQHVAGLSVQHAKREEA